MVLRFLGQIGTWEESRCNSLYVMVSTMEVDNWGPHAGSANTWTHMQCPQTPVLSCMPMVPNGGMVTLLVVWPCPLTSSRQNSLDAVGSEAGEIVTPFPLSLCRVAGVTQTWLHGSGPVSRSQFPSQVPPLLSFPLPCLWFWTQPWPEPSWNRLWVVWPAARHPHCKLLYPGSVDWLLHNQGMGRQSLWYPLVLTTYPEGGSSGSFIHRTQSLCWKPVPLSWLTQSPSAHLQLQGPHWIILPCGQLGLDSKKRNDWGGLSWACSLGNLHAGLSWSGAWVAVTGRGWTTFPWFP